MPDLPTELRTLVLRYGTRVLDDADGLHATLDDFLAEDTAPPGDVNLVVDAVRFGSLERLRTLIDQGADPGAATADVAEALAQRRGGDADSARWACAVLGFASGLLPRPTSRSALLGESTIPPAGIGASDGTKSAAAPYVAPDGPAARDRAASPQAEGPAMQDARQDSAAAVGGTPPPSARGNSTGSPHGGAEDGRGRRHDPWLPAVAGALIVILAAGVVYFMTRGSGDGDTGNEVPVMQISPHFDHFGEGTIEKVLNTCGDASVPGSKYQDFNCSFKDQFGPGTFDLELTEKDKEIVKAQSGVLPDIVTSYPRNTIITEQQGSKNWHAYFLQYVGPGVDRERNTPDDEVSLTLYDVDPDHPGAAIFTARDSAKHPLTHQMADRLLRAIGAATDKFPLPTPFHSSASFANFAEPFRKHANPSCVTAFTKFTGEQEHVRCTTKNYVVDFGYRLKGVAQIARFYRSEPPGNDYNWANSKTGHTGRLSVSGGAVPGRRVLYWDDELENRYGTIVALSTVRTVNQLLAYFKGIEGGRDVHLSHTP